MEIHGRIIFTEALLDFFETVDRAKLPGDIAAQLGKWNAKNEKNKKDLLPPLRLSEPELKSIKVSLQKISVNGKNMWSEICEDRVGNKLGDLWKATEEEFGLTFLTTRLEDNSEYLNSTPDWEKAVKIIEKFGISSADAMIINIFCCSVFGAIVTSDLEFAHVVSQLEPMDKICFIPDHLLEKIKV